MKSTLRLMSLCAALAMAGLPSAGRAQQPLTEVRVAMLAPSSLLWLHAVARDLGFYSEQKIVVRDLVAASSPALLQAVSSGSVEAGMSLGDVVIRAIDQGAPVVISGAMLGKAALRLVGGKGITDAKQLAGATVTAGAVEGGTANLLRFQLQRLGVDPTSVKMVSLTNSRDRIVALGNGQVQGALLIPPFDTLAERSGLKMLDWYAEPYVETPLVLNKPWAEKNRAAAVGLTQALKKAAVWIYDPANKAKAIEVFANFTKVDKDVCEESYNFMVGQQVIGVNLEVTAAGLENIIKIDKAIGANPASSKPFELSRYYDPSYLAAK